MCDTRTRITHTDTHILTLCASALYSIQNQTTLALGSWVVAQSAYIDTFGWKRRRVDRVNEVKGRFSGRIVSLCAVLLTINLPNNAAPRTMEYKRIKSFECTMREVRLCRTEARLFMTINLLNNDQ